MNNKTKRALVAESALRKMERLCDSLTKVSEAVEEIRETVETNQEETGVLLEVRKGKPVVLILGPNGLLNTEPFMDLVDGIGDHGGSEFSASDMREIEVWIRAFDKAAKSLRSDLNRIRKNPSQIPD